MPSVHEDYMQLCLSLAKKACGETFPNPMVGAVVVHQGKIIGQGYHKKFGGAHAEINAINSVKDKSLLSRSTLYVSLEPCCHFGKTPPCTNTIIKHGIPKVIVATKDQNPEVRGKGIAELKKNGVEVKLGVLSKEATLLNEAFFYFHKTKRPYISIKLAQSLDGKIALRNGESKWITSEASLKRVHRLRSEHQAVMTTAKTAIMDNARLTVRLTKRRYPIRIVLDRTLSLPLTADILSTDSPVIIITSHANKGGKKSQTLDNLSHVKCVFVRETERKLNLDDVLLELAKMNIISILVEAGPTLATELVKQKFASVLYLFVAPILLGEKSINSFGDILLTHLKDAPRLTHPTFEPIGEDIFIKGYLPAK